MAADTGRAAITLPMMTRVPEMFVAQLSLADHAPEAFSVLPQ